jgi:hypothetical protein
MNGSHDELSSSLASVRDLEYALACIGDFDLRFDFTNAHGRATPGERALAFYVERARAQARAITSALDVADPNDLNTLDRIHVLAMDLGTTIDSAVASGPAPDCVSNSLERASVLASAIYRALDPAQRGESGIRAVPSAVNGLAPSTGRFNASNRDTCLKAEEPLEKIKRPPVYAEYLLRLLASPERDDVLGDFEEQHQRQFNLILTKRGVRLAQLNYWWQVLRSVPGFLRIWLRRAVRG